MFARPNRIFGNNSTTTRRTAFLIPTIDSLGSHPSMAPISGSSWPPVGVKASEAGWRSHGVVGFLL
jgi:hypothetical protein